MNRKVIYFIYIVILFSAIGFKTVKAYSKVENEKRRIAIENENDIDIPNKNLLIEQIDIEENGKGSRLIFRLASLFKPVAEYYKKDNSLVFDFYDAKISPMVVNSFVARGIKLGYIIQQEGKVRAKIFLKPDFRTSVVYSGKSVVVNVKEKEKIISIKRAEKEKPISPNNTKFSQAIIQFKDAMLKPVVSKLALEAGMEISFDESVPERFTASFESATPFEAIKNIALENNLRLYRSGKVWYMTGR